MMATTSPHSLLVAIGFLSLFFAILLGLKDMASLITLVRRRILPTSTFAAACIKGSGSPWSSRPHQQQQFQSQSQSQSQYQSQSNQLRLFSTTSKTMSPSTAFLNTLAERRSIYPLNAKSPISDSKIQEIIKEAILHVPSSFNSQSERVVLLVKEEHVKLWQIVKDTLKELLGVESEQWKGTEQKLSMFQAAYGSILFFTDRATVKEYQSKFATYADKFPHWAAHSDGMHQLAVWTALEAEGLGANLQHYNPLIDLKVQETWKISPDWDLSAQMVIGEPGQKAGEKTFKPVEGERFLTFGA